MWHVTRQRAVVCVGVLGLILATVSHSGPAHETATATPTIPRPPSKLQTTASPVTAVRPTPRRVEHIEAAPAAPAPEASTHTPAAPTSPDHPKPPSTPRSAGTLWPASAPLPVPAPRKNPAPADSDREPGQWLIASPNLAAARHAAQQLRQAGWRILQRRLHKYLDMVVTTVKAPADLSETHAERQLRQLSPDTLFDAEHRFTPANRDLAPAHGRLYAPALMNWPTHRSVCGQGGRMGILDGTLPTQHPILSEARIVRKSLLPAGIPLAGEDHALALAALLVAPDTGVTPAATLYWGESLRQRGERADTLTTWLLGGLNWLASQSVPVINLSLGGPEDRLLALAIQRLSERGIVVVAAAGNTGPDALPLYPARLPSVIGVTAIDARKRIYRHANRGPGIDFAAPGVDLWLPRREGAAYQTGTSWAAPLVSATILQTHLSLSLPVKQVPGWLARQAEDLGEPGPDPVYGQGLPRLTVSCQHAAHYPEAQNPLSRH